jgi:hypothetical protein
MKVFVSYDHDDFQSFNDLKSINMNPNNAVKFTDWSLSEPVYNEHGHVNRRPPFDPYSDSVNDKILGLLSTADKMLVLIGQDTHSSLWVDWEIKQFRKNNSDNDVLLMRCVNNYNGGVPPQAKGLTVHDWSISLLQKWLR